MTTTQQRSVTVTIPGTPVPKGRPRLGGGHTYTPAATKQATLDAGMLMRAACPEPFDGPLAVKMRFYYEMPKSRPQRERRRLDEVGNVWKHTRPDVDNLVKLILDAGNLILWDDDGVVVRISAQKEYAHDARTVVEVLTLDGEPATIAT